MAQFATCTASAIITIKEYVDHLAVHASILDITTGHGRRELATYKTVVHALATQVQTNGVLAESLFFRFGRMIARIQKGIINMLRIIDPDGPGLTSTRPFIFLYITD